MLRTSIALTAVLLAACSSTPKMETTGESGGSGGSIGGTGAGTVTATGTAAGSGSTGGSGQATSSGSSSGGECSQVGPSIDSFVKSYSMALCDWVFGCQADANYYYDLCMSYSAPGYNSIPPAVDAGRMGYCPGNGLNCLNAFSQAPCFGTPPSESTACKETLRGLVVPGSPCYSTADCSGGFCQSDAGCAGTCVAWAEVGDACSGALPCNPTEGLGCLNSKCVTPREIHSPCGPNTPPCDTTFGLACIAGACAAPPEGLMKPCEFGQGQCVAGSYCFQKIGTSSGKCTQNVALGGVCGEDADHLRNAFSSTDFECADGFTVTQCTGAGTLLDGGVHPGVCTTTAGEDNFCPDVPDGIDLTKPFGSGCLYGLDCLGPQGAATCDRPNPPNKGCYPLPFECDPTKAFCEQFVDGGVDAGFCVAAYRTGQACTGADQCGAFNVCTDAGVCELPTGPVCSPAF